eukprot:2476256-Pleurochrysis_carterae.AAC.1
MHTLTCSHAHANAHTRKSCARAPTRSTATLPGPFVLTLGRLLNSRIPPCLVDGADQARNVLTAPCLVFPCLPSGPLLLSKTAGGYAETAIFVTRVAPTQELIMHGGWLYISGCMLTLLGAVLAFLTAFEMRRTAAAYAYPPIWLYLPRTSDETAAMVSCVLYICGNL